MDLSDVVPSLSEKTIEVFDHGEAADKGTNRCVQSRRFLVWKPRMTTLHPCQVHGGPTTGAWARKESTKLTVGQQYVAHGVFNCCGLQRVSQRRWRSSIGERLSLSCWVQFAWSWISTDSLNKAGGLGGFGNLSSLLEGALPGLPSAFLETSAERESSWSACSPSPPGNQACHHDFDRHREIFHAHPAF